MRQPRYPLQAVLEQRKALREQARLSLAQAIGELEERERELKAAEAARSALAAETERFASHLYDPDEAGLLPIPLIQRRTDGLRNLQGRLREAEQAVTVKEDAVGKAEALVGGRRERLLEADRDLKAAEKHHDAWREEWRRDETRKEQRQSEDVTTARFAAEASGERGPEQGGHS